MQTMGGLYKLHGIHPLSIFKAPLMQLPVFWYFSIDLRKIINGADPELAQGLTEGGLLWVTDLSEPDPDYGLPVLGGLLYDSIGRRATFYAAASLVLCTAAAQLLLTATAVHNTSDAAA